MICIGWDLEQDNSQLWICFLLYTAQLAGILTASERYHLCDGVLEDFPPVSYEWYVCMSVSAALSLSSPGAESPTPIFICGQKLICLDFQVFLLLQQPSFSLELKTSQSTELSFISLSTSRWLYIGTILSTTTAFPLSLLLSENLSYVRVWNVGLCQGEGQEESWLG